MIDPPFRSPRERVGRRASVWLRQVGKHAQEGYFDRERFLDVSAKMRTQRQFAKPRFAKALQT
jgi:hypothetical protein